MFRPSHFAIAGLSPLFLQVAHGQPFTTARAPGRQSDLQLLRSDGREWSKEAILILIGVFVALFGIIVACLVANRPSGLRALVRMSRESKPHLHSPVKEP